MPYSSSNITVIHGPNLNLLGSREPEIYGWETLDSINISLEAEAQSQGYHLSCFQSNSEGALIDAIQKAGRDSLGLVINPAAYSHTSIAIRDALSAINKPSVEVHLSNLYSREEFRRQSLTAGACIGVISGFGAYSYHLGLLSLIQKISLLNPNSSE